MEEHRQIETGRIPNRLALVQDTGGEQRLIAEERWKTSRGITFSLPTTTP